MPATLPETLVLLQQSVLDTADRLLAYSDSELPMPSSHVCGHGEDAWRLISNLIDHETEHMQQVLQGRYEARDMRTRMERLVAEWIEVRAHFTGTLIGLSDEQFNAPTAAGEWSYREVAEHLLGLEQDALKTMAADQAARLRGEPVVAAAH